MCCILVCLVKGVPIHGSKRLVFVAGRNLNVIVIDAVPSVRVSKVDPESKIIGESTSVVLFGVVEVELSEKGPSNASAYRSRILVEDNEDHKTACKHHKKEF